MNQGKQYTEPSDPIPDIEGLAVRPHQAPLHVLTDGPSSLERENCQDERSLQDTTGEDNDLTPEHIAQDPTHSSRLGTVRKCVSSNPTREASSYVLESTHQSSLENGHHHSKMRQVPALDKKVTIESLVPHSHTTPSPKALSTPCETVKPTVYQQFGTPSAQIQRDVSVSESTRRSPMLPRPEDAHMVLHEISGRMGPPRVMKTHQNSQHAPDVLPQTQKIGGHTQKPSKASAIDIAYHSLREAFLADQQQVHDHFAAKVNNLKEDKAELQNTILEQQCTAAELRVKLKASDHSLLRLTEKADRKSVV